MDDATEILADDALRIDSIRVEATNGETYDLIVTENTGVDDDAYVDGHYGGTKTTYHFEGSVEDGEQTVGFWMNVEIPRGSDTASIEMFETEAYRGREERVEIVDLEITEERDEPYAPYQA